MDATNDLRSVAELVRWASGELQQESTPTNAELLWRHGVLAILQGAVALDWVDRELNVAKTRFPAEPRWLLIRAWHTELTGVRAPVQAPLEGTIELPPSVIRAYEDAIRAPDTHAEAATRLAYLRCAAGRPDLAIDLATQGATLTTESDIRSLAHLIHGWALTRLSRPAEALAEFRAAHESLPASQSAALWFARSLFLIGQRAEAELLIDETMRTGLGEFDPFKLYSRGDLRLWPALILELRRAIQ
jgi:tetratricopeptide (TPR) repeat protein